MIFGERVRQARQLNGLNQTQFAEALGVTQPMIAQIESGRLEPSEPLLETMAFKTGFPPSFFRQALETDFPTAYKLIFRAKANTTNREADRALRYAQVGYRILRHLLERVQPIPLRLPDGLQPGQSPADAADLTRASLGLPMDEPIKTLFRVVERAGVIGLTLPVRLEGIDAFYMWTGPENDRPMVVTSYVTDDGARLRWSIAHEIGHLVLHRAISGRFKELEDDANAFAQQFLLPDRVMHDELDLPVTLSSVAELKQRWGVSMQALIYRAWSLEIITHRQRTYLFQQLSSRGWRTREPPNLDVPLERPQSLPQLAKMFYGDPIDVAHLGADTNLAPRMVESFLFVHGAADSTNLRERERELLKLEAFA